MTRARYIALFLRQFALSLAAVCLLAQAAIPDGFMLAASPEGFPAKIVLCGSGGQTTIDATDLTGGGSDRDDGAADQGPCVFAASMAAVAQPVQAVAPAPARWIHIAFRPATARTLLAIGPNAPPPSRAPPAIV